MDIITLAKEYYNDWDIFILQNDSGWFWHTTKWMDYYLSYGLKDYETKNVSFFIKDNDGIIAVVPLFLEKRTDDNNEGTHYEFSAAGSGGGGIVPALSNNLSKERRETILRIIFEKVDCLARDYNVVKVSFRMTPLSLNNNHFNWLLQYGYLDCSLNTQIIDLSISIDSLYGALRRRNKSYVNSGQEYYEIKYFDENNPDKQIFDQYRILHHKAAGRVTRPIETFEMMYQWLLDGNGLLCGLAKDSRFVAFVYVIMYKNNAYPASASDDPNFEPKIPISQVMQWAIIKKLKEKGLGLYEIGTQQYGPLFYDFPSEKDINISFFKRGFGGSTIPLFRGEKYYDIAHMQKVLNARASALIEAYSNNSDNKLKQAV